MNQNIALVLLASTLFVGCASAPKVSSSGATIPDWVSHPQASYPENRYLSAVGNGASRNEAIEDAKKQLAESFVVKVQSETKSLNKSSLAQSTSGSVSGDSSQDVQNNVSLQTDTYLRGAEVKEVAPVGSQFYALVALDKLSARSGLLLEANRIQAKLSPMVDQLETKYSGQQMKAAREQLQSLEQLYGEASALGMSALIDVSSFESRLAKVDAANRTRNQKLIFSVKTIQGDSRFARDVEQCINEHGGIVYSNTKVPAEANSIELSVIERPQHMQMEGWTKIRFDLTGAVVEMSGKMYRIQTSETETGRSHDAVLEMVSDKLSKDFCENLFSRMGDIN